MNETDMNFYVKYITLEKQPNNTKFSKRTMIYVLKQLFEDVPTSSCC